MICRPEEGTLLADRLPTERPATGSDAAPVELAKEPPFGFGGVIVTPASREIAAPDGSRQVLEPRVGGLHEDLGVVSRPAQDALNAQHLVTDGVAIPQGREYLMNRDSHP